MTKDLPNIPPPPDAPDPVSDDTWDPEEFPATIGGIVEKRETFERKRDGEPFEVLTLRTDDQLVRVLCGRVHLAQLVAENDPQPGDGISITCFGREDGGPRFLYGLRVDKSARLSDKPTGSVLNEPLEELA